MNEYKYLVVRTTHQGMRGPIKVLAAATTYRRALEFQLELTRYRIEEDPGIIDLTRGTLEAGLGPTYQMSQKEWDWWKKNWTSRVANKRFRVI